MVSLIYFQVSKVPSVGIGALIYGGLSHIVSYGVFGKNGTQDVSKGKEQTISEFKSLLLHTLLERSSSFHLFPCSNFFRNA